jgi:murein DD-endopeptidase MepM/ murein hydrolase activator NlpD
MTVQRLIGGSWANFVDNLERWFPERQVFYRRRGQVNFVSFSRGLQISFAGLLLIFSGWVGYSSIYYLSFDWILRDKNRQLAEARVSYRNVMDEVANYNDRLMSITHNLEATQTQLLGLFGSGGADGDADAAHGKNRFTDLDRAVAAASHRQFTKQIQGLEKEWRELTARNATLEHGLASIGNEVETILAEHGIVTAERDRLRTRVRELEVQVVHMRTTEDAVVSNVTERTTSTIDEVERVISMTGLKVDKLVAEIGNDKTASLGQGGPFISVKDDNTDPLELKVAVLGSQLDRWNRLRLVLRHLPLAAPLDHYRLSSNFGVRRDPITQQLSRHNGIDLTYELNTPIMNTAPGKVVFTGWRPGLGWTVEIDHGMGIRTRYGHLRTILAKQGDEIGFRDKVGLLGNTGRSTGPHVHYEILVNGKPVDPTNFIMAGKYVFKG